MCGIEYAPGPFAGRGGVSWCHLLSLLPPLVLGEGRGAVTHGNNLGVRYNVRIASLLQYAAYSCESNLPFDAACDPAWGETFGTQGKGEVDFAICPTASH